MHHDPNAPLEEGFVNDARFLRRIEEARASLRAGQGVRLEHIPEDDAEQTGGAAQ